MKSRYDSAHTRGPVLRPLVMAILGAVAVSMAHAAAPPPGPPVAIGYSAPTLDASPVWVAQELGFFTRNGLGVRDLVPLSGGTRTAEALVRGEIQFGVLAAPAVVEAAARGAGVVLILSLQSSLNYDLVVIPGIPTGQQLKGKTLGISGPTGSSTAALRYALRQFFALAPDRDVQLVTIGDEEERLAALHARRIHGTVLSPEIVTKARKSGLVVLVRLGDKHIPYQHTSVAVRRAYADQQPQTVRAVVKSLVEAIAFYKSDHNRDAVKTVLRTYLPKADPSSLEKGYDTMAKLVLQPAPYVSEAGVQFLIAESRAARQQGLTVADLVNNTFVKELDALGVIRGLYR